MSKGRSKQSLYNGKITDAFQPVASSRSSRTSSAAPSSSPIPVKKLKQTQLPSGHFRPTQKNNVPPRADQEVIALSSGSSSEAATHVSISSDSVVCVGRKVAGQVVDSSTDSSAIQIVSPPRALRSRKQRPAAPVTSPRAPEARKQSQVQPTSQRRVSPHRRPKLVFPKVQGPIKRKFPLESEDEDQGDVSSVLPQTRQASSTTLSSSHLGPLIAKENVPVASNTSERLRSESPPKKARLSSPEPDTHPPSVGNDPSSGNDADIEEIIPSSQSDEQELTQSKVIERKDLSEVAKEVHKWRTNSLLASPNKSLPLSSSLELDNSFPMDVDVRLDRVDPLDVNFPSASGSMPREGSASEAEVSLELHDISLTSISSPVDAPSTVPAVPSSPLTDLQTLSSVPQSPAFPFGEELDRPSTPPAINDLAPLPPTPIALDAESKAAKIIAEIKAKVLAAVSESSDEDEVLEIPEKAESSDDDFDDSFLKSAKKEKGKGKAYASSRSSPDPFSSPLSGVESRLSPAPPTRYNLRHHSPSTAATRLSLDHASLAKPKSRKSTNPLDFLLKEKRSKDKGGKGMEALRNAEAVLQASSSSSRLDALKREMESEDESAWNENDPSGATRRTALFPDADEDSDDEDKEEAMLRDVENNADLKDGKAVGLILAKDRKNKNAKSRAKKRVIGISLWTTDISSAGQADDENMRVDSLPPLCIGEINVSQQPLLALLCTSVTSGDVAQIIAILNSGSISLLDAQHLKVIIPWIFELAISPTSTQLSDAAYHFLLNCRFSQSSAAALESKSVLCALQRLGANQDILQNLPWDIAPTVDVPQQSVEVEASWRAEMLYRLVSLIATFSRNGRIDHDSLPDVTLALMLVALETSTQQGLKQDVMVSFEEIGRSLPHDLDASLKIEALICAKVTSFLRPLSLVNKAYLLTSIIGGCPSTSRMARWISRSMLLDEGVIASESYTPLPALSPILELLSPAVGSQALFDLQGNADNEEYYEDLSCSIAILSKVLTDIDSYVLDEMRNNTQSAAPSTGEPAPKELERIKTLLDVLHGKIVDTRAAHLDRSRAKAALQRLSFRVHYQRLASTRSYASGTRPQKLTGYFPRHKS